MPYTDALSLTDDTYCLPRVPAAFLGPLNFVARSMKYLRYYAVGCFTIADSLSACHSLPQYDN